MTVYKIRHKDSGKFLNRNGSLSTRGKVYTHLGHIRMGLGGYARVQNDEEYEIVTLELTETGIIPITSIMKP